MVSIVLATPFFGQSTPLRSLKKTSDYTQLFVSYGEIIVDLLSLLLRPLLTSFSSNMLHVRCESLVKSHELFH